MVQHAATITTAPILLMVLLALLMHDTIAFIPSHKLHSGLAPSPFQLLPSMRTGRALAAVAFGGKARKQAAAAAAANKRDRFDRTASAAVESEQPCILTIHGAQYNVAAWAKAHPAGDRILHKFHNKDASKAFEAAAHSHRAYEMLEQFKISPDPAAAAAAAATTAVATVATAIPATSTAKTILRWRQKLFTKEDPRGFHKTMGIFVLLHFFFRYSQMYFSDPSCGLGMRMGKGPSIVPALCLVPHALLSLSSLIFHTVPKERIVGKPMIWQEYRIHNIAFGVRSVVTSLLAWLSIYKAHAPIWRRTAVWGSCVTVLTALVVADEGTRRLRVDSHESTTATMPYWEGCSLETQRRFKTFYAYSQFMATLACLHVGNPGYALAVLIPIQLASLLMTLVRKGLISARNYHYGYTASLVMPYFVGLRSMAVAPSWDMPVLFGLGWALYQLRRRGINKYALWAPVLFARATIGDSFINWAVW